MLRNFRTYFREALWNFPLSQETGFRHFWLKWLRISYLALRGFFRDKCSLSASSLTYYTIMSIVPILALALAIARGFGYQEKLQAEMLHRFPDQEVAFTELFKYASTLLEQAKGGIIAGVGLGLLFLTVALLLHNLEGILNHIWGVKKQRRWQRIASDYFAIMLIAPIFFIFASSVTVFVVESIEKGIEVLPISKWAISWLLFLVNLIPYGLFGFLFTFLYLVMPNTQVSFRSASIAGIFAGALYLFVQLSYIYFQIGVNRYGAIYGSMAAVPLFFIWVQVSWFILLLGAELSCAHQTVGQHEFEGSFEAMSARLRKLFGLWILSLAVKRGIVTLEMLTQIPFFVSKPILEELVDCDLLHKIQEGYVPSAKTMEMRISDCLEALESQGKNHFPFIDAKMLAVLQNIEKIPLNTRISHVPDSI